MATKSIYKTVRIKDQKSCIHLVKALENAKNKKSKDVVISKKVETVTGEKIKEIFGV